MRRINSLLITVVGHGRRQHHGSCLPRTKHSSCLRVLRAQACSVPLSIAILSPCGPHSQSVWVASPPRSQPSYLRGGAGNPLYRLVAQDGRWRYLVPDRPPPTLPLPVPSRGVFLSLAPTRPAQKPPSKSWTGCLSLLVSKLRPGPSGAGSAVRRRLLRVSREASRSTRVFFLFFGR